LGGVVNKAKTMVSEREMGDLTARVSKMEERQDNHEARLREIRDALYSLSKRIAQLMVAGSIITTLAGAAGWWMTKMGIAPLG